MKKTVILGLVLLFVICSVKGQNKPENRWLVGFQVGRGHLVASAAAAEKNLQNMGVSKAQSKDFTKQLRNGFHFSGDVHYLIRDFWGVGVKYSFFTSSAGINFYVKDNSNIPQFYPVGGNEKFYVNYVGPSFIFQQWLGKKRKFRLTEEVSGGYVHFRDEARFDQNQLAVSNILTTGYNYGGNLEYSIEYFLFPCLSIGASAGFFYSSLTKIDISDKDRTQTVNLDEDKYQNISRLNYALSIRYSF